jgi:HAD superfamily hydrolase (TIGR01458 family)
VAWPDGIHGVLLDVDGTLLVGDEAVPGAAEAVDRLRGSGLRLRLSTNTTRMSIGAVAARLQRAGIRVDAGEILAPSILARRLILGSRRTRVGCLLAPEALVDLEGVERDVDHPDWVVVGDLGPGFTWERLNQAFGWLRQGAGLIALQKNRFWNAGREGWVLDAGPFVCALEYASGVAAEVVGKPSARFFELCLAELALSAAAVLVVGDDASTDGLGGAAAGCRTALVRTGKYAVSGAAAGGFEPDLVVDSVADL